MHVTVKVSLVAAMVALASTARSELVWEKTELELHPGGGDETAVGHFKYQNKGEKPIAIKSVTTSCGCTAASAKQSADPGEKGEVTATFKIGDRTGLQLKTINVVTDDPVQPNTALTLKVAIPTILELQPAFVYWQSGEEPKPKTIVAKAGAGVAIKKLEVDSSHPDFTAKVEAGKAKGEFQIKVEPRQTTQAVAATLTIKPALEKGAKILYASARVMPATTANAAPITETETPAASQAVHVISSGKSKIDACALLTSQEIEAVEGEPMKQEQALGKSIKGFAISQCYFTMPTPGSSISLTVMQKGDDTEAREPREQWKEIFGKEPPARKAGSKAGGFEKIDGVGEAAYWSANPLGGELYVLKGDIYIRLNVGGSGDQPTKIKKSKALAELALKRL